MSNLKQIVIGLYGVPGVGKTFLLAGLKESFGEEEYDFYEGSEMISKVVPGGLNAFHKLEKEEKAHWRQVAIDKIRERSANNRKVAVVTGHFMFWDEEKEAGYTVMTRKDLEVYSHIIYLDIPTAIVLRRRSADNDRARAPVSEAHLSKWQQDEKTQLRDLCRRHGILFLAMSKPSPRAVLTLLRDFGKHSESYNTSVAVRELDSVITAEQPGLNTAVVLDADRTLAPEDTGSLFWKKLKGRESTLKELFSGPLQYSYTAFRQASLLHEEVTDDDQFEALCRTIAGEVTMYPEFKSLLKVVAEENHTQAVVVSCGLRRVWEMVLEREGVSHSVKVIGGGRISDGFVVTANVKAALVRQLRATHGMHVWAFGDSPLDLEMLKEANHAVVVVGDETSRSKTMEADLRSSIAKGLRTRQALLPPDVLPRLDPMILPIVSFSERGFIDSIINNHRKPDIRVIEATNTNAARLLMTATRDERHCGPMLREAHRRIGAYLATHFLTELIGIEEYLIPHVQGHKTSGYRLLNEDKTSVVALMRGGEPMALGVNDVFPLAMFIHARCPVDIELQHLAGQTTVLLVDSVVNSGKTVVQFIERVRELNPTIRIVVVAGVIQSRSVRGENPNQGLASQRDVSLVTLRLSENAFTGRGTTDTGNRLFNTTHIC
ncbi:hypothetical protein M501DRAFT_943718 [Patellaria atrata CBS 101060]|uniref:Phosphoribosyltransferase domain-containing protein n=1 Tax=Patellaria atrata CBS 101060 TaxID=1346257 RepID=A0A9P4VMH2_9PEZI|nr:hypothetical protein M501DRAFT_943718 [Patellaria atrata CBS 101060]